MRMAEVRIDAWLRKGVLINRPLAGKNSRGTVRIVRRTKLRINLARRAAGNTVATLGPGPSHRVARRDVECVWYKHIAALPDSHIKNLAARWDAAHGRSPVLIHNSDPRASRLFRLRRVQTFVTGPSLRRKYQRKSCRQAKGKSYYSV